MPKPDNTFSAQAESARIVSVWFKTGRFPDRLIPADSPQRALVMEIVYGVAKWKRRLHWTLRQCADGRIRAEPLPYALVGLYQIFLMDGTPDHAAVHATVEAAKPHLHASAVGFLNAVLRRALRERSALDARLDKTSIGIRLSHPDALTNRWLKRMPARDVEALCAWNNTRPLATVRARDTTVCTRELRDTLRQANIHADPHPFAPDHVLALSHGQAVFDLPGFADGRWIVQDPSAAVAVDLLDPQPGENILDACAAPGGKLALIADRTGGTARLTAIDLHADRLALLQNTLTRLKTVGVRIEQLNATDRAALRERFGLQVFDKILIDAPCSNTGVLRRRPDARWRFSKKRLAALCRTQRAMLDACAPLLKPDGTLVYSTCSLEPEENESMIADWLAANPAFRLAASRSLFPPDTGADGTFAACLTTRSTDY